MFKAHSYSLPDIEAHQFKVTPLEKSKTGRVYRFKVNDEQLPKVGNIILIEEDGKPTLAFRVLNTDSKDYKFVGKRVRRYDTTSELKLNTHYDAAEKIADLVAPPPGEIAKIERADPNAKPMMDPVPTATVAPQVNAVPVMGEQPIAQAPPVAQANPAVTEPPPQAPVPENPPPVSNTTTSIQANKATAEVPLLPDLPESSPPVTDTPALVTQAQPNVTDSALDAPNGVTPPASKVAQNNLPVDQYDDALDSGTPTNAASDEQDPYRDDIVVKERTVLNPFNYMLNLDIGSYKNLTNGNFGNDSSGGAALSFSHVTKRSWLFKKDMPQDTLNLEYGFAYYSLQNVNQHNDHYTFLPLKIEVRYDIHLSELFTPFLYVGAQYNLILSTENVDRTHNQQDATTYNSLVGAQPNFGIGLFYTIGPQWSMRINTGLDRFSIGLAVRW